MLVETLAIAPARVHVLDGDDHEEAVRGWTERGATYSVRRIERHNLGEVLEGLAGPGDVLVNVTVGVDSVALADWCQHSGVSYVDSSIEPWDDVAWDAEQPMRERTEYAYHQVSRRYAATRWRKDGPSAVFCHGANPGLVSHFAKAALCDLADALGLDFEAPSDAGGWAALAERTGTRVIHISERDTQVSSEPKRPGEFVNTWSVPGFLEEASMPVEIGWGTHEKALPPGAVQHPSGPRNAIYIPRAAARAWIRSWVPLGGAIDGIAIPHSESVTLSDYLTRRDEDGRPAYRPTVVFSYLPCDGALASLHESVMRDWQAPESERILNHDIVEGRDELGVLLLGHRLGGWWYGSQLDIHEARRLVPGNNPTAIQVAAGFSRPCSGSSTTRIAATWSRKRCPTIKCSRWPGPTSARWSARPPTGPRSSGARTTSRSPVSTSKIPGSSRTSSSAERGAAAEAAGPPRVEATPRKEEQRFRPRSPRPIRPGRRALPRGVPPSACGRSAAERSPAARAVRHAARGRSSATP